VSLLHGDVVAAWRLNALTFVVLPLLIFEYSKAVRRLLRWKSGATKFPITYGSATCLRRLAAGARGDESEFCQMKPRPSRLRRGRARGALRFAVLENGSSEKEKVL
jgi:hypothetical protein